MNTDPGIRDDAGACDAREPDLPPRARSVGVVAWCSFLVASAATMVVFAYVDPEAVEIAGMPDWFRNRLTVYALGFFSLWAVAASSAALALYMAHTERALPPKQ